MINEERGFKEKIFLKKSKIYSNFYKLFFNKTLKILIGFFSLKMISSLPMDNLLHHCNSPLNNPSNTNPTSSPNNISATSVTTPNSPNTMFMGINTNKTNLDSPISFPNNNLKRRYEHLQDESSNNYTNGINLASISPTDEVKN